MLAKIIIIAVFFAVTIGIGLYCRRHATNVGDFVLGGRSVGPWLTAFSYGTSYFSAVVFIGYAGQFGWSYGVSATWIGIGNAFIGSMLAWMLLGRRTRIMTKHFDSATMPDFFARRYDSSRLKSAASIIIFLFLIPYSASVYKGLSGLFSMAFHIDFTVCIIAMAVITAIYVIAGGYMATAINDLVQGFIMLGGIVMVVWAILAGKGGFTPALEQLSHITSELNPAMDGALVSFCGPDPLNLLGVVILTSLGTWGLPQMVHKFYTIKNEASIKAGTVISTVFALIIAGGSYFMGGFGRLYYTPGEGGKVVFDSIVPQMLASSLPDIMIGIVLILVLSASMSTLSSLVITSSSTFVLDFLRPVLKNLSAKGMMILIKTMCGFFVLLSVLLALNPNSLISTLMSLSWGALAGAFLGPFLFGLFWKGTTKNAVWVSFALSILITGGNFFFKVVSPINAGAIAIVASLLVVPIVSLVTPKLPADHIQDCFACYDETAPVAHRTALPDKE